MSNVYSTIESAVGAALVSATASPFVTANVHVDKSHLSDVELMEFVTTLASANKTPAAVVLYGGGNVSGAFKDGRAEDADLEVVVVAAKSTREGAGLTGLDLVWFVRDALHQKTGISGVNNPLQWQNQGKYRLPGTPSTVAAWIVSFKELIRF